MMGSTFKERIMELMHKGESVRAFAVRCGLSDSTVRHYLAETSEPTLGKIEMIAKACNVTVGWLASGEEKDNPNMLDRRLMAFIALLIESRLKERKASLPTAKKMELICVLYDDMQVDPQNLYKKTDDYVGLLVE